MVSQAEDRLRLASVHLAAFIQQRIRHGYRRQRIAPIRIAILGAGRPQRQRGGMLAGDWQPFPGEKFSVAEAGS